MTDLIKHWRKAFELPITGDFSDANVHLFVRLFTEEVREVLEEVLNTEEEQVAKLVEALKVISSNAHTFSLPVKLIDKKNLGKELADVEYIVDGHGWMQCGLDKVDTHIKVFASNMSKTCATEGEAMQSCSTGNPHLKIDPEDVRYRKNAYGRYIIYDKNTNKVLKGINYKPFNKV